MGEVAVRLMWSEMRTGVPGAHYRDRSHDARVAGDRSPPEAGDVGVVDRREGLTDEVRAVPPAGAEDEGHVVPVCPGPLPDDGRGRIGYGEGVGRTVVEVGRGGVGHGGSVARARVGRAVAVLRSPARTGRSVPSTSL